MIIITLFVQFVVIVYIRLMLCSVFKSYFWLIHNTTSKLSLLFSEHLFSISYYTQLLFPPKISFYYGYHFYFYFISLGCSCFYNLVAALFIGQVFLLLFSFCCMTVVFVISALLNLFSLKWVLYSIFPFLLFCSGGCQALYFYSIIIFLGIRGLFCHFFFLNESSRITIKTLTLIIKSSLKPQWKHWSM